ncbi:MAG: hypothetical protein Q7T44_04780 [Parvibaculum sp.]|nr:hypothetical protein [Parvibaculum sp.]
MLAILVRAVLPDGWMPTPPVAHKDANWVPFVICTSDGLVQHLSADSDEEPVKDDGTGSRNFAPCPFAAAAHLAPVDNHAATLLPQTVVYHPAEFAVQVDAPHLRDVFERKRSRSPPLLLI